MRQHDVPTGDENLNRGQSLDSGQGADFGHVVRIDSEADQEKAIEGFLRVPQTRCRIADNLFLLTNEHTAVLRRLEIPFEEITQK